MAWVITNTNLCGAVSFVTKVSADETLELSNQIGDAKIINNYYSSAVYDMNAILDKHNIHGDDRAQYAVEDFARYYRIQFGQHSGF